MLTIGVARGERCAGWPIHSRAQARNAAMSPPACRPCARSRQPHPLPRLRTGPARSAYRAPGPVPPRSASPTCPDCRSTCRRRFSAGCGRDFRRHSCVVLSAWRVRRNLRTGSAVWQPLPLRRSGSADECAHQPVRCRPRRGASGAILDVKRPCRECELHAGVLHQIHVRRSTASRSRNSLA